MTMLFRSSHRLPSIAVGMPAVVLMLLVLGGCAQLDRLHHRGDHATATPVVAPPPPAPAAPVETPAAVRPLGEIINDDLQLDLRAGNGLHNGVGPDYFVGAGVSHRF